MNADKCVTEPCILLMHVDEIYNCEDAAKRIVKTQLVGIYSVGTAKDMLNPTTADLAADLFIANHGHRCTLYQLLLYFAKYVSDFKETRSTFDVQDIIQQYGKKFLPWWNSIVPEKKEEPVKSNKPKGQAALDEYLKSKAARGEDLRTGGLYELGWVNEDTIKHIEENNAF